MTNRTAATRYARALLDVSVKEKGDLERISQDLGAWVDLLAQHPTLERVLLNPAIPVARKEAAVAQLNARLKTSGVLAKLVMLLAGRDRLVLLPDLQASYRERLLEYHNVVRAEITTAAPLSPDRAQAIERRLADVTGRTVTMATKIDPGIIGGVVARIGSTVYDGSITTQLRNMKRRLVESV
jgi:F-type H+-transporting ATPase subunit delta